MRVLRFSDRFVSALPGDNGPPQTPRPVVGAAWSHAVPTPVRAPTLVLQVPEVAALLGLHDDDVRDLLPVLAGNLVLPGMRPYAACYGGHQFGQWAGQLGDGRAISLGELVAPSGELLELQLKGAGPTPYARNADGRAVLRSSIRELLCSEAMHHLGVPTTRALSLVATGEDVERDRRYDGNPRLEPGAVVCRVAPSFLRFGNYELPASRGDVLLLTRLVDFTIATYCPALAALPVPEQRAAFFAEVCTRTAALMAHWLRVGFVHGVMNTDNMSILGLTLDYGPFGFVESFDAGWTPNTTDARERRYRFGAQPDVAAWNLARLAQALAPIVDDKALAGGLDAYERAYKDASRTMTAAKLGLARLGDDDAAWLTELFALLERASADMTLFFRGLAAVDPRAPSLAPVDAAFVDDEHRAAHGPAVGAWLSTWAARVVHEGAPVDERRARMNAANPRFVLRHALLEDAIAAAEAGDASAVATLLDVVRRPYDEQPGRERYAARRVAREPPMLSCSS